MIDAGTLTRDERRLRAALAAHRGSPHSQLHRWRTALTLAVYAGDLMQAQTVLREAADEVAPVDIFDDILTPALHDIGTLWERNVIGIADEHVATSTAQHLIAGVAALFAPETVTAGATALLAAPPSERHTMPLLMAEAVLRAAGYRPVLVGAGVPPASLADAVRRHAPALVALTTTIAVPGELTAAARAVLEQDPEVTLVVGGAAARFAPSSLPMKIATGMRELTRLIEPASAHRDRRVPPAGEAARVVVAEREVPRRPDAPEAGADPLDEWVTELRLSASDVAVCRRALLRVAEERGRSGSWAWDLGSSRIIWSENMFRILGFRRGDGAPTIADILERAHPDDRAALADAFARAAHHDELPELTYRLLTPTGKTRFLHADLAVRLPRADGGVLVGWLRDITEEREAERQIAAHGAVSAAMRSWQGTEQSAPQLLAGLGSALGFTRGTLTVPTGKVLVLRATWAADDSAALAEELDGVRIRYGQGLAGRAWEQGDLLSVGDLHGDPRFRLIRGTNGLHGAIAMPIMHGGEVLAVIGLAGPDDLELTTQLRGTLTEIAQELGAFFARRIADLRGGVLSPREVEILRLAAEGLSGPAIASRLFLSPSTVKTHFENIYAKYEVTDRVAAVAKALREGLIW